MCRAFLCFRAHTRTLGYTSQIMVYYGMAHSFTVSLRKIPHTVFSGSFTSFRLFPSA